MKKHMFKVAALLLAGSMLTTSCIGSFSLFNRYEKWQCNMTNSKIVNGIVGFILQPIAGTICLFVDAVVLNTIEFWSGQNPMSASTQTVRGNDGKLYTVKASKKGYEISDGTQTVAQFIHDPQTDAWLLEQNGETTEIFRYNADGTIRATMRSGHAITVTNDAAGLAVVREVSAYDNCYALN